jgi:uncharacterized protein
MSVFEGVHPHWQRAWVVSMIALIGLQAACDKPSTRVERGQVEQGLSEDKARSVPRSFDSEVKEEGQERSGPAVAEGIGKRCIEDHHCSGYLRCMDERCAIPPAVTGEAVETTPVVRFRRERDEGSEELARFYMELARTPEEMSRGLMFRRSMQPDWGMIFIYDDDYIRRFWMKNTLIALDMIFVHSSGEVMGVVANAEPLTLVPRSVERPARYVVELNAGKAAKYGIEAGTWMRVDHVDPAYRTRF